MAAVKLLKLVLILVAMSSIEGQTFQYSRGWTNGKRSDVHKSGQDLDLTTLQRIFSNPCQVEKLKYILDGKPISDKLFLPCDILFPAMDDLPEDGSEPRLRRTIVKSLSTTGNAPVRTNADTDNFL